MKKILISTTLAFLFISCTKDNPSSNSNSNNPPLQPAITNFSPLAAAIDSLVTITGTNFSTDITKDTVRINGTIAIVKSATESTLVVMVPANATPGKITITIGANTATSGSNFIIGDQWTVKKVFPGLFRTYVTSFRIGNKLYVGMGIGVMSDLPLNDFWEYDITNDVWTQKASFPGVSSDFGVGFSIGNKGYVVMNPDTTITNRDSMGVSLWQYDTTFNTWARKADFPDELRATQVAFGINNYGYVGMGYSPALFYDLWQYDPTGDSWTKKANYTGIAPSHASSFVIANYAYVGAGMNNGTSSGSTEFFQYDPSSDGWTKKADLPGSGRNSAVGFSVGAYGYLGTGYDINGHYLSDFWQYNPTSNTWTKKADFGGGPRAQTSGFSGVNQGYMGFGNGENNNIYNIDLWQYQP